MLLLATRIVETKVIFQDQGKERNGQHAIAESNILNPELDRITTIKHGGDGCIE